MKTDIQIARECELKPIGEIAEQLGIEPEKIEPYGRYMAKVPVNLIDEKKVKQSRLILVTAISPTKAGIGKTTFFEMLVPPCLKEYYQVAQENEQRMNGLSESAPEVPQKPAAPADTVASQTPAAPLVNMPKP